MSDRWTIREEAKADAYYESIADREECPQSHSGRHVIDEREITYNPRYGLSVICRECGMGSFQLAVEVLIECVSDAIEWPAR